ncbi:MAG: FAD-dependent oxidoreductase, partial [Proteobacteria bacterium]|nr:FAD-dependent oxidoreductase [Pseudomonadota bacterium]
MTLAQLANAWEVVVIGAGPAGLAAAATTASAGMQTLLVDENEGPGGQIYRSVAASPIKTKSLLGDDYWHGETLVAALTSSGATYLPGTAVWSLDRELSVGLSRQGAARLISAQRVIIATGAIERPMPIKGWTLPGVMTVGAAQTMLKASAMVPDGRTVIAGTGPLLWLLAAQLLRAGGKVEAILDTTPSGAMLAALPHAPGFVLSPLFRKGLALKREVSAKVRVVKGIIALAADGDGKVERISYLARSGSSETLPVDTLLLHQGVVPNVNLAMAAGVEHRWHERLHAWVPTVDEWGASSVQGIAVAGDGAGIAGALAAEDRGRLAGIAAIRAIAPQAGVPNEQS